jgi:2,3-bisphosphoglycerate-dependent phosphoglycerate mutase
MQSGGRWIEGPRALWLVRHGESEGNVLRVAAEQAGLERVDVGVRDPDVPLSQTGVEQAIAFGRWLARKPSALLPTALIVSPFVRTRETANYLLEGAGTPLSGVTVDCDERLRDREMGQLDQLTWPGIEARHPAEAARARYLGQYYFRPPGGESWADICLRLRGFLADLRHDFSRERVLVVSHDALIQLTRSILQSLDEHETVALIASTPYANCGLTAFEHADGQYQMTAYNETAPVEERRRGHQGE